MLVADSGQRPIRILLDDVTAIILSLRRLLPYPKIFRRANSQPASKTGTEQQGYRWGDLSSRCACLRVVCMVLTSMTATLDGRWADCLL